MHKRASSAAIILGALALAPSPSVYAQDAPLDVIAARRARVSAVCVGTHDPFVDGACDLSEAERGAMRVATVRGADQLAGKFDDYTQRHPWTLRRFIMFDFVLSVELHGRGLPGPVDADLATAVHALVEDTARLLPSADDIQLRTVKANLEALMFRNFERIDAATLVAAFKISSSGFTPQRTP